jgi:hypothetical protein
MAVERADDDDVVSLHDEPSRRTHTQHVLFEQELKHSRSGKRHTPKDGLLVRMEGVAQANRMLCVIGLGSVGQRRSVDLLAQVGVIRDHDLRHSSESGATREERAGVGRGRGRGRGRRSSGSAVKTTRVMGETRPPVFLSSRVGAWPGTRRLRAVMRGERKPARLRPAFCGQPLPAEIRGNYRSLHTRLRSRRKTYVSHCVKREISWADQALVTPSSVPSADIRDVS